MRETIKITLFLFSVAFLLAVSANAATLTVTSTADAGGTCPGSDCTLRQAIATASPGDTINFAASVNRINLTTAELLINKSLTISGPGANLLTVQRSTAGGTPNFRIFDIPSVLPIPAVTISGLTIANGNATVFPADSGGGIFSNGGPLTITGCVIAGNSASQGGGIQHTNGSPVTITDSTISGNSATTGGGISNGLNILNLTNSTVFGNSAVYGGGIFNRDRLNCTNSTVSGNSATGIGTDDGGGGICNFPGLVGPGKINLTNCTVARNSAIKNNGGGGIYNYNDTNVVVVRNSIIAKNTDGGVSPDFKGTLTSKGYNLIGNTSGTTIIDTTTGNQLNVDPKLGPLQDNGGPIFTHALLSGSSAIEGGNSSGSNTDQRGFARPVDSPAIPNATGGDGSDIGAYEVQADQLPGCGNTLVTNNRDSGPGSLRFMIDNQCGGEGITFASSVVSPINLTSGELLLTKAMTIFGPGANLLTVQRDPSATTNFRIFHISSGSSFDNIIGLTIVKGNPADVGGGIFNENGTLTVSGCTISGNSVSNFGPFTSGGGGFYNFATATFFNTTISGNSATGSGGGIYNNIGTVTIYTSTVSGNSAADSSSGNGGGGIYNAGTMNLTNSTVSNNSGSNGGGVYNYAGNTVSVRNSIIAGNAPAIGSSPDFNGALTSQNFNLIGNSSGASITPAQFSDQIGTAVAPIDPMLGPLQDNGGPTRTHALLSGSRAIDRGHASDGLPFDQRYLTVPVDNPAIPNASGGDGSDIGAFEVQAPTLLNLSTRKQVGTGDNVLIGGFIVVGTEPKKVIVRGLGPSLPVSRPLADPTLELRDATKALLASNNNWKDTQQTEITATGIPPSNDLESAIVISLDAKPVASGGAGYTAILAGNGGGTGIGLLEIYDLATTANSRLANISTRGFVGTADDLLIGGFIPGPLDRGSMKVLIRALGPSLSSSGVSNPLQDPFLELHDGNGNTLQTNDNWKDSQQAEIQATGIPPTNNSEAALIATVPPSNSGYTALVRGVGNTTGVALVEVFSLN